MDSFTFFDSKPRIFHLWAHSNYNAMINHDELSDIEPVYWSDVPVTLIHNIRTFLYSVFRANKFFIGNKLCGNELLDFEPLTQKLPSNCILINTSKVNTYGLGGKDMSIGAGAVCRLMRTPDYIAGNSYKSLIKNIVHKSFRRIVSLRNAKTKFTIREHEAEDDIVIIPPDTVYLNKVVRFYREGE